MANKENILHIISLLSHKDESNYNVGRFLQKTENVNIKEIFNVWGFTYFRLFKLKSGKFRLVLRSEDSKVTIQRSDKRFFVNISEKYIDGSVKFYFDEEIIDTVHKLFQLIKYRQEMKILINEDKK